MENYKEVEKALHKALYKHRYEKNKEFFKINPDNLKPLLEILAVKTETPSRTNLKSFRQEGNLVAKRLIDKEKIEQKETTKDIRNLNNNNQINRFNLRNTNNQNRNPFR